MPAPPPTRAPPPGINATALNTTIDNPAYENNVSSIKAALLVNGIIGLVCFLGFLVCRSFMAQYQLRRHLASVTIRPPPMPTGAARFFSWIKPIFTTSDVWVLHSAGLDGLVLLKSIAMCIQIFLPIAVVGCALLMPLQLAEAFERGDQTFSRLTMANIRPRSPIMWSHWVFTLVFVGWTLLLLEWHFKQYVVLRQHYLRSSNGVNYWRRLHMAQADGEGVHDHARFADIVGNVKMDSLLEAMNQENATPPPATWWRSALAWMTSWTGQESPEAVVALEKDLTQSDADALVAQLRSVRTPATSPTPAGPVAEGTEGTEGSAPLVPPSSPPSGGPAGAAAASRGARSVTIAIPPGGDGDGDESEDGISGDVCVERAVAPKWWTTVDVVRTGEGKLRRLTNEERAQTKGNNLMLARPSVRYFKTVNTRDAAGSAVAVQAQQYAVLVTSVDQAVYPEFAGAKTPYALGAGTCGEAVVKYSDADDTWMGERYRRLRLARDATAAPPAAAPGAVELGSLASSEGVGKGDIEAAAPAGVNGGKGAAPAEGVPGESLAARKRAMLHSAVGSMSRNRGGSGKGAPGAVSAARAPAPSAGRGTELWGWARQAMKDGRLRKLAVSDRYSLVAAVFSSLFPNDFDRVVPVFNFRETDILMRRWDAVMGRLEAAHHALRLGGKRGTVKVKGVQVDRIAWLEERAVTLEAEVLEARERALVLNGAPSCFVIFRSQKAAAVASSCNIHPLSKELFQVHPAPGPEEVNWQALWYTNKQRAWRAFMVTPVIILLVVLPVSLLTGAMTQLNVALCSPNNKVLRWEAYCRGDNPILEVAESLLTGFVPALLIMLWQALAMPRLVFLCAQSEARHYSLSALDRRIGSIYFLWTCFNFFGGGVIGSTALAELPTFVEKPMETPQRLGYALPSSAKFFLTYMILRTLMTVPLRFLLPQPGVWQAWVRMGLSPFLKGMKDVNATPRALFMRNAIRSPRYGIEFGGNLCLVLLVSFAYATICPLVPLFGLAFFCGNWVFWRYQLLYNYARHYESGGLFFVFLADRIMVCAAIMVAFTGCVLIVKAAWAQATILTIVGLVSILAYYRRTRTLYINGLREMPLLVAQMAPRARVPASVYVPPPLQTGGLGWYPEHNKVWAFLGMPGYSW